VGYWVRGGLGRREREKEREERGERRAILPRGTRGKIKPPKQRWEPLRGREGKKHF